MNRPINRQVTAESPQLVEGRGIFIPAHKEIFIYNVHAFWDLLTPGSICQESEHFHLQILIIYLGPFLKSSQPRLSLCSDLTHSFSQRHDHTTYAVCAYLSYVEVPKERWDCDDLQS